MDYLPQGLAGPAGGRDQRCPSPFSSGSASTSRAPLDTPTAKGSSTATSSRTTSCSTITETRSWPTSASPAPSPTTSSRPARTWSWARRNTSLPSRRAAIPWMGGRTSIPWGSRSTERRRASFRSTATTGTRSRASTSRTAPPARGSTTRRSRASSSASFSSASRRILATGIRPARPYVRRSAPSAPREGRDDRDAQHAVDRCRPDRPPAQASGARPHGHAAAGCRRLPSQWLTWPPPIWGVAASPATIPWQRLTAGRPHRRAPGDRVSAATTRPGGDGSRRPARWRHFSRSAPLDTAGAPPARVPAGAKPGPRRRRPARAGRRQRHPPPTPAGAPHGTGSLRGPGPSALGKLDSPRHHPGTASPAPPRYRPRCRSAPVLGHPRCRAAIGASLRLRALDGWARDQRHARRSRGSAHAPRRRRTPSRSPPATARRIAIRSASTVNRPATAVRVRLVCGT